MTFLENEPPEQEATDMEMRIADAYQRGLREGIERALAVADEAATLPPDPPDADGDWDAGYSVGFDTAWSGSSQWIASKIRALLPREDA